MIVGIGIDIVSVRRIKPWLDQPKLCKKYFHPEELETVHLRKAASPQALAARFAAKEAFGKALGTGFAGLRLTDIWVTNSGNGCPKLVIEGQAKDLLANKGVNRVHLSLSHEKDFAIAQVILED